LIFHGPTGLIECGSNTNPAITSIDGQRIYRVGEGMDGRRRIWVQLTRIKRLPKFDYSLPVHHTFLIRETNSMK
jgi:hypothetical protein